MFISNFAQSKKHTWINEYETLQLLHVTFTTLGNKFIFTATEYVMNTEYVSNKIIANTWFRDCLRNSLTGLLRYLIFVVCILTAE